MLEVPDAAYLPSQLVLLSATPGLPTNPCRWPQVPGGLLSAEEALHGEMSIENGSSI